MLHWNTVSDQLKKYLLVLMEAEVLKDHRLVGGTALSLYLGHRMSVDIDLFTDAGNYGQTDYNEIERFLSKSFPYVSGDFGSDPVFGKSYLVGEHKDEVIKLDIYYAAEPFFSELVVTDGVRLASVEEIIAMKVDVVRRGGRKKDFWDLHELLGQYSVAQMLALHERGFNWVHDRAAILRNFTDFREADEDFDPICLQAKEWIFIKEDIEAAVGLSDPTN